MAPLTDIFSIYIITVELLSDWKAAVVNPLFKDGDKANLNCYRPISILTCPFKLEKLTRS